MVSGLQAAKAPDSAQPVLYLRMQLAQYELLGGRTAECRAIVDEGVAELDALADVSARRAALGSG